LFDAMLIALEQIDLADELAAARRANVQAADAAAPSRQKLQRRPPEELTRELLLAQVALILEEIVENNPPTQLGNCSPAMGEHGGADEDLEAPANKAILLFSDGSDTASAASIDDTIPPEAIQGEQARPNPDESDEASGANRAGLGTWHNVRVEVRRPLLKVITRPGYYR
jgi:hypothetical protein